MIHVVQSRGDVDWLLAWDRHNSIGKLRVVVTTHGKHPSVLRNLWRLYTLQTVESLCLDVREVDGVLGLSHLFPLFQGAGRHSRIRKLHIFFTRLRLHPIQQWSVHMPIESLTLHGEMDVPGHFPLASVSKLVQLCVWLDAGDVCTWFRTLCLGSLTSLAVLSVDVDLPMAEMQTFFWLLEGLLALEQLRLRIHVGAEDPLAQPLFPSLSHVAGVLCRVDAPCIPRYALHRWIAAVFRQRVQGASIAIDVLHAAESPLYPERPVFCVGGARTNDEQLAFVINHVCFANRETVHCRRRKRANVGGHTDGDRGACEHADAEGRGALL